MHYTYILQSKKDNKFYTGSTSDLRKRLIEHNLNKVQSTKNRGPFDLIYYEACKDTHDAFIREKYLKSGQGKRYLKNRIKRFLFITEQVKKVHPVRSQSLKATKTSNRGFIALISVILISFMLFAITYAVGMTSFLSRFNILDSASKQRSLALAEACQDSAIFKITEGNYVQNQEILVGPKQEDKCIILSAFQNTPTQGQTAIKTQSVINKSYTNLFIIIDDDFNVIDWRECPNFTNSTTSC